MEFSRFPLKLIVWVMENQCPQRDFCLQRVFVAVDSAVDVVSENKPQREWVCTIRAVTENGRELRLAIRRPGDRLPWM